jgi:hypothetical protein
VITPEDGHTLTTAGLDLGDKTIQACFVDHHGEIVEESRMKATEAVLRRRFSGEPRYRTQADLAVLRSRAALVRARTTLVNHLRGAVKSIGGRLPRCVTKHVAEQAALHQRRSWDHGALEPTHCRRHLVAKTDR